MSNSILFVCTGNIFRSMTADYVLKAALGTRGGYSIGSAGTVANPQEVSPFVMSRLRELGIDARGHRQRKVGAALLEQAGLVVAMGLDHRDYLGSRFNRGSQLFNRICFGKDEPVLDGWEAVPDWRNNQAALRVHVESVVDHVYRAIPHFIRNMRNYLGRMTPLNKVF